MSSETKIVCGQTYSGGCKRKAISCQSTRSTNKLVTSWCTFFKITSIYVAHKFTKFLRIICDAIVEYACRKWEIPKYFSGGLGGGGIFMLFFFWREGVLRGGDTSRNLDQKGIKLRWEGTAWVQSVQKTAQKLDFVNTKIECSEACGSFLSVFVLCFKRIVACLSTRSLGFEHSPVHMGFVVDKVTLG